MKIFSPYTMSLLDPNTFLSTLLLHNPSLFSSLAFRDKVSHSYKARCKIILLYILIFTFFRQETVNRMAASITQI